MQDKHIQLDWRNGVTEPIPLPSTEVRQILLNLLLNAVEAVDERGRVVSAVTPSETELEVRVENDGVGLNDNQLQHLFEPFAESRRKGKGLGLWMTYQLATQLARPHRSAEQTGTDRLHRQVADRRMTNAHTAQVCLVEDDDIMGESLVDRFALEGFSCDWHKSAQSAASDLKEKRYDVVVSDIRLPDRDGDDLFEAVAGRAALRSAVDLHHRLRDDRAGDRVDEAGCGRLRDQAVRSRSARREASCLRSRVVRTTSGCRRWVSRRECGASRTCCRASPRNRRRS